jgi:hypothetical protein
MIARQLMSEKQVTYILGTSLLRGQPMTRTDRTTELEQTRLEYWKALVSYMRRRESPVVFHKPTSSHQLRATAYVLGSGNVILVALATVRPVRIGVGVEIAASTGYYTALERDSSKIQIAIGCQPEQKQMFEWNFETKVSDIWLYWQVDFFERRMWPEQHEWLCNKLEAFRRALSPRIAEILNTAS